MRTQSRWLRFAVAPKRETRVVRTLDYYVSFQTHSLSFLRSATTEDGRRVARILAEMDREEDWAWKAAVGQFRSCFQDFPRTPWKDAEAEWRNDILSTRHLSRST